MPLTPGARIELELEKAAAGGRMLGRHEGQVVLCWGGIPGERVTAQIERTGKGVAYATAVDILSPSTDRRPYAGDWRCGGNTLAHIAYERQLRIKGEIVQDAFARIARLPLPAEPDVVGSPETGYRMRARLHARAGRLGFYREGTHDLCDATATGQLLPATGAWIEQAQSTLASLGGTAAALGGIEIAENVAGDQRVVHLELHAGANVSRFGALGGGLAGLSAQRADRRDLEQLSGSPFIADAIQVADDVVLALRRDVRAFFQGNRFLLERLVRHVAGLVPSGPVIDLYAGVGLFGLALAAAGGDSVSVVEGDAVSGADLQANARPFGGRVHVHRTSVEAFLVGGRGRRHGGTWLADPPRTGMSKEALAGIVDSAPERLVYVSCDVATLARDTHVLVGAGYTIESLVAFDLFPNTAHVESVVAFRRER